MKVSCTSNRVDVTVPLDDLENSMLLITAIGSLLSPDYKKWRTFTDTIRRSFATKGHLVIMLAEKDRLGLDPGAHVEFHSAPVACKARVNGVLSFYMPTGTDLNLCDVILIAQ